VIPFKQALDIVLAQSIPISDETVRTPDSLGRFLADPVLSPLDAPPFDKAAMDGYAIADGDDRDEYRLRDTIAAGNAPAVNPLSHGEADKIMTGAPLPPGAGKVIRVEFTEPCNGGFRMIEPEPYANIIRQGENIRAGEPLLRPCRLEAKELGCLAAAGFAGIKVKHRLKIGIINTGNELKNPGETLSPGEIYDSNGPQLIAQITAAGALPVSYGIVPDDREAHGTAVSRGLAECDILILTGGVSKGDFDYVPEILKESGVEELFHGVRVKPGRPTWFGRSEKTIVFGLPGNPVSVFIQFEAMVKPLICRLNGVDYREKTARGRLTKVLKRRDVDRAEFLPATVTITGNGLEVTPIRYKGSSHLNAMALADSLIFVPAGVGRLEKGDIVDARFL
jgi:molybdopterin molybdotransferase